MKGIKEHIKTGQYKTVYLLYGTETYLRRFYTSKLKAGALAGGDEMNLSVFSGKDTDWNEVRNLAETMPFFAEHRVIVLENTGAFKNACDFADEISRIPESAVLIFNETEVDKRSRMFKAVKEHGYVCEMNGLGESDLMLWSAQLLNRDGKKISKDDLRFFLERVGSDMENIESEAEKLVCYTGEREVITKEDILAVTVEQISGKIFAMIDALGAKDKKLALKLYHDLLAVREKPMTVLYLMVRQCNMILQAAEMNRQGLDRSAIASKAGMPPFAVGKCLSQAKNFTKEQLFRLVTYGTELEEQIKTGRIDERIAVELFLLNAVGAS
ncbi:MAG: DNA polymerase III subunit delta [Lachnospiraceae bacterium]|nr:DNA polymerase III subunit delta [Lachnospiraceae bacterium]